jgi:rhomboid protease GluP
MRQKLVLIFVPFLLASAGMLAGYTLLHWLLIGELDRHAIKEDYVNIWIPFLLPWTVLLTWIRPRIKLLRFATGGNPVFAYQLFGAMIMAAPIVIAQEYLDTAAGKLTQLSRPDLIGDQAATKFYSISHYYIGTSHPGTAYIAQVTGRTSSDLDLSLYIACPIDDESMAPTRIGAVAVSMQPDTTNMITLGYGTAGFNFQRPAPRAWCCVHYYKRISNRLSTEEKEDQEHSFYNQSMATFSDIDFRSIVYWQRTGYNDRYDGFKKAIKKTGLQVNDSSLTYILEPKFDAFASRNGQKLPWIFGSWAIGLLLWFGMIMIPPIDEEKLKVLLSNEIA